VKISEVSSLKLNRIHIIGSPASGKTYLAKILSKKLNIRHYDLDNVTFKRKYNIKRPAEERARILKKICSKKRWITEGVYWKWINEALRKSNIIIWLDFPLTLTTLRIIHRHFVRKLTGEAKKSDLIPLLKYSLRYKFGKRTAYQDYKQTVKPYKSKVITVRNGKEIDRLIRAINQKDL
jgi:adenylate kinase family enzyme